MRFLNVSLILVAVAAAHAYEIDKWSPFNGPGEVQMSRRLTALSNSTAAYEVGDLATAVFAQETEEVLTILNCDCVDVNEPSAVAERNRTVLFLAAQVGNVAIIRLLLKAGADPNAKGDFGVLPIHLAALYSQATAIVELLEAGVDVNAKTHGSETPLHLVANIQDTPLSAEILLDAGAEIDAVDETGETPLHEAVAYGSARVARTLLERGANVTAETNDGYTPMDYICDCLNYVGKDLIQCPPGQCLASDVLDIKDILDEFLPKEEGASGETPSKTDSNKKTDGKKNKKEKNVGDGDSSKESASETEKSIIEGGPTTLDQLKAKLKERQKRKG